MNEATIQKMIMGADEHQPLFANKQYTECGYLNPDQTCNSTRLCDCKDCSVIETNYNNVEDKALAMVNSGIELIKELSIERRHK